MRLRGNRTVIGLCAAYVAAVAAVGLQYRFPVNWSPLGQLTMYAAVAWLILSGMVLVGLARERPASARNWIVAAAGRWKLKDRLLLAAPALLALSVMLPVFSSFKSAIPLMHPFTLDPLFADWDEALHAGPAWKLIHPLVGYPIVTAAISLGYQVWIAVFYLALIWTACWVERPALRRQFLVAFVLSWAVLGTVGAVLTASVGPCFYELFYQDGRFGELMGYLHGADRIAPNPSLAVQDKLIAWYEAREFGLGRGISAMPSMHVAIATLLVLLGWQVSRGWGIAASLFLLAIMVGSVHLGYHYAIDGYVSMAATPLLWWIAGRTVAAPRPALAPAE